MSYTYPEALAALEAISNDYIKVLIPHGYAPVSIICDMNAKTASVTWDTYSIRINMPVRAATSRMTQAEFEDWVAYVLHELGHPTHTEQAVWRVAVKAGHARMLNALEDVRMEKALIASGIVLNARAVLSRLIGRKVAEARATGWKPNSRKEIGWTICILGRVANGYLIDAVDVTWIHAQIKPGSTVDSVLSWAMPELAACQSTQDCLTLAAKISQAIAAPQEANEPDKPGNEGEGEGSSSSDERQGEGEGEGEGDNGSGKNKKPTSDAPKASEEPSEGNGGKGGKGSGETDDDETPVNSENELSERDLAPESNETVTGSSARAAQKMVIDILRDKVMTSQPRNFDTSSRGAKIGTSRLRDAAANASKQRALLARALRANEIDEREGGLKSGRLVGRALPHAMAGATNVFARREVSEGYDTDVCVLLDASGSMSGTNMFSALEAGLIIAQAASSVGAPCTTEIFNSRGYVRAGTLASKRLPVPSDFGALVNGAEGGTPLSAHMARAGVAQAKRAGQMRRVLFIITDGGCDYGPQTVKAMADYLERTHGTILAHVSIGTPLSGSFKAEVCVPYGAPLAEVGLAHFVKVLQSL